MTSDDLDLRKGHLVLRTMLRYVTDPNHVDSSADYAFIPGILPRKGIKWKCQTFCVWPDLWRHRWPRGQIFKLYLKDLVQTSLLPFDFFFATSIGYQDRWGPLRPPPPQQRAGVGLGPAGRGLTGYSVLFAGHHPIHPCSSPELWFCRAW